MKIPQQKVQYFSCPTLLQSLHGIYITATLQDKEGQYSRAFYMLSGPIQDSATVLLGPLQHSLVPCNAPWSFQPSLPIFNHTWPSQTIPGTLEYSLTFLVLPGHLQSSLVFSNNPWPSLTLSVPSQPSLSHSNTPCTSRTLSVSPQPSLAFPYSITIYTTP